MSFLLANRKAQLPSRTRASSSRSAQAWREAAATLRRHVGGYSCGRPAQLGNTCPIAFGGSMPEVDT